MMSANHITIHPQGCICHPSCRVETMSITRNSQLLQSATLQAIFIGSSRMRVAFRGTGKFLPVPYSQYTFSLPTPGQQHHCQGC